MTQYPDYPVKTRDLHNHHMDSTVWDEFVFRDDDIIIGTWAKSGTTWMQQIIGQLVLGPDPDLRAMELSPWLDIRVMPRTEILAQMEAQTHRRFVKTHLPLDALTFSPRAKYIYVGRDARDVVWSLFNHHHQFNDEAYRMFNETPGLVGPPLPRPIDDVREYWHQWLDRDGYPFWSFFENVSTWWAARNLPNVMLVHFNDLKADMEGAMGEIAAFLEIETNPDTWPEIVEYCSFDWMKANAERITPMASMLFKDGSQGFINKGTNSRWRDVLSTAECAEFEAIAKEKLGEECANWLAHGMGGR